MRSKHSVFYAEHLAPSRTVSDSSVGLGVDDVSDSAMDVADRDVSPETCVELDVNSLSHTMPDVPVHNN